MRKITSFLQKKHQQPDANKKKTKTLEVSGIHIGSKIKIKMKKKGVQIKLAATTTTSCQKSKPFKLVFKARITFYLYFQEYYTTVAPCLLNK